MKRQKLYSVGDLAHRHGVHESEVIAWAEDNDVPKLGREFALSESDKKKFEKWIAEQVEEAAGDGDLDDDEAEDAEGDEDDEEDDDDDEDDEDDED